MLIDLVSFRDLYGYMTSDREKEARALQAQTHARQVSRETAEADLFGGDAELEAKASATAIDDSSTFSAGRREAAQENLIHPMESLLTQRVMFTLRND